MEILTWRRVRRAASTVLLVLSASLALTACSAGVSVGAEGVDAVDTYTDPGYGYSFSYPSSWQVEDDYRLEATGGASASGSIAVIDPDGAMAGDYHIDLVEISVYELNTTVDETMLPQVKAEVESVLADIAGQDDTWRTVEPLSDTTVADIKGFRTTVGYDMDGVATTAMLYFLFNGDLEYELMLQAADESWGDKRADFDAIVASFVPGTQ